MSGSYYADAFHRQQEAFDTAFPLVADWFVLEGAELDVSYRPPLGFPAADLGGIQYFMGFPTADNTDAFAVEVAALVWEKPPYSTESLREMVGRKFQQSEADNIREFTEFGEEGVWAIIRMTRAEVTCESTLNDCLLRLVSTAEMMKELMH